MGFAEGSFLLELLRQRVGQDYSGFYQPSALCLEKEKNSGSEKKRLLSSCMGIILSIF